VLDKLRQIGAAENTMVVFLADNGGCAEEIGAQWRGLAIAQKTRTGRAVQVGNNPDVVPGPADTFQSYGIAWANASNTPFRLYKHYVHEGGIATPMIVRFPGVVRAEGSITREIAHVIDLVPTCLELAQANYPRDFGGHTLEPLRGRSLLPVFRGQSLQERTLFWEHEGNRAVREGKWKLVSKYPGPWELYNMQADRTELNNLADQFPVIVEAMSKAYDDWAKRNDVEQWRR
jgi:arylsulfatase